MAKSKPPTPATQSQSFPKSALYGTNPITAGTPPTLPVVSAISGETGEAQDARRAFYAGCALTGIIARMGCSLSELAAGLTPDEIRLSFHYADAMLRVEKDRTQIRTNLTPTS